MSCCRRIYDCRNRYVDISPSYHHHLEPARSSMCSRITGFVGRILSSPFVWAHAFYNTAQLAKHKEFAVPLKDTVARYSRPIVPFPFPNMNIFVISEPSSIRPFLRAPRHDPSESGFFEDKVNHEIFIPVLRDIVEQCHRLTPKESTSSCEGPVSRNDFLFTCDALHATAYRDLLIQFMGPKNQRQIRMELEDIVITTIGDISRTGNIDDVTAFCGTFTAMAISQIFLNHPGPKSTYREIHWAMQLIDRFAMKKRWTKISRCEFADYNKAIYIIAEAIILAEKNAQPNSFVTAMKDANFSETQIKGMLFLVYLAGSGTTTTALKYLLWQLGQNPKVQEQIHSQSSEAEKIDLISKCIAEALRLSPSVGMVGRFSKIDLRYSIKNKEKEIYHYTIPKGSCVLSSPLLAGRNISHFPKDTNDFRPQRFEDGADLFPSLPFIGNFHQCPGKHLALSNLSILVLRMLERYKIASTPVQPDLVPHLFLTLHHPTQVQLKLSPRE